MTFVDLLDNLSEDGWKKVEVHIDLLLLNVGWIVYDVDYIGQAAFSVDILEILEDCYDWKILRFDFQTKTAMAVVA